MKENLDVISSWALERSNPRGSERIILRFAEFAKKSPNELLTMQHDANSKQDDERYAVVDLLQKYVKTLVGRRSSKLVIYATVKSWFRSNRRMLPRDLDLDFIRKLKNDRPATSTKLTIDILRDILTRLRGDARMRSLILCQLQSFSGLHEILLINQNYASYIAKRIQAGDKIIELEMRWGRKQHERSWYTYIGTAAIEALKQYFENERGWPKDGEPIWCNKRYKDSPLTSRSYTQAWTRILVSMGFRPPPPRQNGGNGDPYAHFGFSIHKMRTLAISQSQLAIGQRLENGCAFNPESAEYFSGHQIDDLGYRKIHELDARYRRQQYSLVEQFLNPYRREQVEQQYEDRIASLERQLAGIREVFNIRGEDPHVIANPEEHGYVKPIKSR